MQLYQLFLCFGAYIVTISLVTQGSTDEQFMISKRHGPLFHLLLSTMDKYEPDIELSPETTTPTTTDSTANFFDSDGMNWMGYCQQSPLGSPSVIYSNISPWTFQSSGKVSRRFRKK